MSISQFAYDPPDGWRNHDRFPTYESEEAQVREDMQDLYDQVRDYINNTVVAKWNNNKLDQVALLPTSGANMKYIRRNATTNVIETSTNGSSWSATANNGHVILDGNGDAATQRPRLRFMGATVTDTDGTTVVHSLDVISTATETNLTGALVGDGEHVGARDIETAPREDSTALITSGALYDETEARAVSVDGKIIAVTIQGVTSLPRTVTIIAGSGGGGVPDPTNPDLTPSYVLRDCVLSDPDALWGDITATISINNTFTIDGEFFGESDITLIFDLPYTYSAV